MVWNLIMEVSGYEAFILAIRSTMGTDQTAFAVSGGRQAARG
jgi:hypothetical protein